MSYWKPLDTISDRPEVSMAKEVRFQPVGKSSFPNRFQQELYIESHVELIIAVLTIHPH